MLELRVRWLQRAAKTITREEVHQLFVHLEQAGQRSSDGRSVREPWAGLRCARAELADDRQGGGSEGKLCRVRTERSVLLPSAAFLSDHHLVGRVIALPSNE